MSDRRLRGHPTMVAKYDAEGREKPIDRFESPRAVPLHYREHSDARVVIGPDGYPALHHEALDLITAGAARDGARPDGARPCSGRNVVALRAGDGLGRG